MPEKIFNLVVMLAAGSSAFAFFSAMALLVKRIWGCLLWEQCQ